jgi:N-acetylglutamate synthase-like GNAT family acetyltransferase
MNQYLVRRPETNEITESLIALYRAFGRIVPNNISDHAKLINALIDSSIAKFLIAEKKGKIVGLGALFLFQDVCSIGYMGVLPEVRRNGVGTEIFNKLINKGRVVGCKTFTLYASKLGEPIYHKFGFRSGYRTTLYALPNDSQNPQKLNPNVQIAKKLPDWASEIDKEAIGFDRRDFLKIKLNYGSKLLILNKQGYALISGLRLGPLIAKNLDTAVALIRTGMSLGAMHIIIANHSKFPQTLFDKIKLTKREEDSNLRMIYGKNISQKLDYFYALGTYAKG